VSEVPASSPGERAYLLLLAREVPDPPAHVLEAGAALARVAGGDDLDPRPVEVALVDALDHLLDEVVRGVEVHVRAAGAAAGDLGSPPAAAAPPPPPPAAPLSRIVSRYPLIHLLPAINPHRRPLVLVGSVERYNEKGGPLLVGFLVWRGRAKESGVRPW
jgi:hypothetical protein